jgi:hypothetical protein
MLREVYEGKFPDLSLKCPRELIRGIDEAFLVLSEIGKLSSSIPKEVR